MKFRRIEDEFVKCTWGYHLETRHFSFSFCNANINESSLSETNGPVQFLQQVHSSRVLFFEQLQTPLPQGDALWTKSKSFNLAVKTADCLPILVGHPEFVMAIHAGWRGLVSGIVTQALVDVPKNSSLLVAIGPHIGAQSFEVGLDVIDQLAKVATENVILPHQNPQKAFVSLQQLACSQLTSLGLSPEQILITSIDTHTDKSWHSYRRDKVGAGRNLSFCHLS